MTVIAKAEVTISDILDGNSISEITNFYKVSSKSSGETAPQTSGGRNLIIGTSKAEVNTNWKLNGWFVDDFTTYEPGIYRLRANNGWSGCRYTGLTDYIGKTVTISFQAMCISEETTSDESWGLGIINAVGTNPYITEMITSETPKKDIWLYLSKTVVLNEDGQIGIVARCSKENAGHDTVWLIKNLKLELGNKATDWTPAPEDVGWSTTVPTLTDTNKYLWNYEMITGSDGQVISYTEPRVIGVYGDKGQTGSTGATGPTGNGIKSITEYYQISTSNTTAPTTWLTTVPTLTATNKYLWNYEKITYTNGTSVDTAKRVIGVYGDKGNTGATGPAGKGIKSTAITYQASTSGTTAPTGTWNSTVPSVPQGQYLWSRTVITYTDNTTSTTYSVAYIPKNGQNGATGSTGATGTGIANITQQYYLSTSKTSQTGGSWVTSMPTWSSGKYLWTRYKIDYKNPASTSYTTPVCDSSWEAVNDIQVGGRNLIKNGRGNTKTGFFTGFETVTEDYGEHTFTSKNFYISISLKDGFTVKVRDYEPGRILTWSFDIMFTRWDIPTGAYITEFVMGQRYANQTIEGGSTEGIWRPVTEISLPRVGTNGCELNKWYHVEKEVTIPQRAAEGIGVQEHILFHNRSTDIEATISFRLKNVKLEYGNIATDWTPAPEDIQADIEQVRTEYKADLKVERERITANVNATNELGVRTSTLEQTADGLTSDVSKLTTDLTDAKSSISQNADRIESNVQETTSLGNRVSTVEQTANGLSSKVTGLEGEVSTLEQTASGLSVTVGNLNNDVSNAAKTATNFLGFDSNGLVVADKRTSTLGRNILIGTTDIKMRNGTTELATFGESLIDLGKNSDNTVISMNNGRGKISTVKGTLTIESGEIFTDDIDVYFEDGVDIVDSSDIIATTTETIYTSAYTGQYRIYNKAKIVDLLAPSESNDKNNVAYVSVKNDKGGVSPTVTLFAKSTKDSNYNKVLISPTGISTNHSIISKASFVASSGFTCGGITEKFTNKLLWSGIIYPLNTQTATFSEPVRSQPHGIVLCFSGYTPGTGAHTSDWMYFFIPKNHAKGDGTARAIKISAIINSGTWLVSKTLYLYNGKLVGAAENQAFQTMIKLDSLPDFGDGTSTPYLSYANNRLVLREIYGC